MVGAARPRTAADSVAERRHIEAQPKGAAATLAEIWSAIGDMPVAMRKLDSDRFNLDGSIRFENVHASGGGTQGGSEFLVNSNGVLIPAITSNSAREVFNYSRSYTSWTAGALFKVNPNTTPFVRAPYMPDLIYTVQANYDFGDIVTLGVSTTGQSSIIDDAGRSYPGGAVVGIDLTIKPIENLEFGIQGYNVFNRYDLRGSGRLPFLPWRSQHYRARQAGSRDGQCVRSANHRQTRRLRAA